MKCAPAWRIVACLSALVAFSMCAHAEEPAAEFLQALRQAGLHDIALEYLEKGKASHSFDAEFERSLSYELGVTLVDVAQAQRSDRERDEYFERAIATLSGFVEDNAGNTKVDEARVQLVGLNIRLALGRIERATAAGADKATNIADARKFFEEAEKIADRRLKEAETAFVKFRGFDAKRDKEREDEYKSALVDVGFARSHRCQTDYFRAQLCAAKSDEHIAQLKKAAAGFNKIYADYEKLHYYTSLEARVHEGRCYQSMGDVKQATAVFDECLSGPSEPDIFRDLKTRTFVYACELWSDPAVGRPESASERGGEWLMQSRTSEMHNPDWLALRYFVALSKEAIVNAADPKTPKEEPAKINATMRQQTSTDAISIVRPAASLPNSYRSKAQSLLDRLVGLSKKSLEEPKSFAEAKHRGDDLFANVRAKMLAQGKPATGDLQPAAAEKSNAEMSLVELQSQVIDVYRLALSLAQPVDEPNEVNTVRFNLCLMYYQQGKFYDAATIGEYLLRRHPQSPEARGAAKIALASWSKLNLRRIETRQDNDFELSRMTAIEQLALATWTDKKSTDDTNTLLANIYAEQGSLAAAEDHLNRVSDDFPKKPAAMRSLGEALSRKYFAKQCLPEGERPADADLAATIEKAQQLIEESIKQLDEAGRVTPKLVIAAQTLAQIYVDDGKHIQAIPLIEHVKYGPLTLVNAKSPLLVSIPPKNFPRDIYNLALRAYIGAIGQSPEYLAKAEKAIADLEQIVDSEELLLSYSRITQELEKLLADAPAEQRQSIAASYANVLIESRDGGNAKSYVALVCILKSFEGLAEGVSNDHAPLSEVARNYYAEAAATAERVFALAEEKKFDPPLDQTTLLTVRAVLANCASRTGNLDTALDMYETILGSMPHTLAVQVDAAMAYQRMGQDDAKYFAYALKGGRPGMPTGETPKIWGWSEISKVALEHPRHIDTFHEARYQIAVCYYELGRAAVAERAKAAYLGNAKKATLAIYKQFPTMGGPELRARYDALIKRVQRELGEEQAGLAEFDRISSTSTVQATN